MKAKILVNKLILALALATSAASVIPAHADQTDMKEKLDSRKTDPALTDQEQANEPINEEMQAVITLAALYKHCRALKGNFVSIEQKKACKEIFKQAAPYKKELIKLGKHIELVTKEELEK